jgi:hypothetical protein
VPRIRSCLWDIKVQIAFSAESAQEFIQYDVEASPQVWCFMAYAFRADLHNPSRESQTALISQLDDLISKYDKEGHWLYDLIPRLKGHCNFLEISTPGGLGGHVKDRLRMVTTRGSKPQPLHCFALF